MKPTIAAEIEAKFLNLPPDIRDRLTAIGANCVQPERLMRRCTLDTPERVLNAKNAWLRVRDEGDKVTMSYKQVVDNASATGTKEVTVKVDDYMNARLFLLAAGFEIKGEQESKRESWVWEDVQIEIDTWPWLPSFVEIEAPSEEKLWQVAEKLGLDRTKAQHGGIDDVYPHFYQVTPAEANEWKEIKFGPVPDWLEAKRKA